MSSKVLHRLTALKIKQARKRGYLGDGGGLYLQVSLAVAKSWVFRYRSGPKGNLREMGLGRYPDLSLGQAREAALQQRQARLQGLDPISERQQGRAKARVEAAKALTFRQCARQYVEAHKAAWRNPKHIRQWSSTLETYAYPVIGGLRSSRSTRPWSCKF